MNRRTLLKAGGSLGALAAAGVWGRYRWLPPGPSPVLASVDELARRFVATLAPETRERVCVEYDHPLRQYHNRGVWGGGLAIDAGSFSWEQRGLLTDLLYAGLSAQGRARVPHEFFTQWGGVHRMNVLVCGDPSAPPYQVLLTGPHLNLRLGGRSREGVAFGGPQVYGDQRGNERAGLPGNLYRDQLELGASLFRSLAPGLQRAALLESSPIQTQIELQGSGGDFPGIPLARCSPESLALARSLVDAILATYPEPDSAYARECLAANGGLGALSFSVYADGEVDGSGLYQNFRLEGPAAVFYFRGAPHVHAFVNVAMDGDAPLSVGEVLGENPSVVDGAGVKRLIERALIAATGADLAHYNAEAVVGRLRKGTIRTGDVYALESWQDVVVVASIRGSRLPEELQRQLTEERRALEPARLYTVATTDEALGGLASVEAQRRGGLVRDAAIEYLRAHGFAGLTPG